MMRRPHWTLRDYVEQTPRHQLFAPVVVAATRTGGWVRAYQLDGDVSLFVRLLVEQEDGSMHEVELEDVSYDDRASERQARPQVQQHPAGA